MASAVLDVAALGALFLLGLFVPTIATDPTIIGSLDGDQVVLALAGAASVGAVTSLIGGVFLQAFEGWFNRDDAIDAAFPETLRATDDLTFLRFGRKSLTLEYRFFADASDGLVRAVENLHSAGRNAIYAGVALSIGAYASERVFGAANPDAVTILVVIAIVVFLLGVGRELSARSMMLIWARERAAERVASSQTSTDRAPR